MQNAKEVTFGVSPAYFVSTYGETFGPGEIAISLPDLVELEFRHYQTEIFDRSALEQWDPRRSAELVRQAGDTGLRSDVFVAHFLGHEFAKTSAIQNLSGGADDLARVIDLAAPMGGEATLVIPILPLCPDGSSFDTVWPAFVEKVGRFAEHTRDAGVRFAVETVPGSLVSSSAWFDRLCADLDCDELWYVLDTGNAWASGECVPHVAERMRERTAATHLCDATRCDSRAAEPGTGHVDWARTVGALLDDEFSGGLDIEITCAAAEVPVVYRRAREYLTRAAGWGEDGGVQHE